MNFRRIILIVAATAAVFTSCKKDETDEVKPYISGAMSIHGLPEFVSPGKIYTLTATGAVKPEDKEMKYIWKVSPVMDKYDTIDVFSYSFKDTLCTFTIYCNAIADGYTSNSTFAQTTSVKAGRDGSVQGIDFYTVENIKDKYRCIGIGTDLWSVDNLAEGNSLAFRSAEVMADIFGRFYTYEEAVSACESLSGGWTLPTKEDWERLEANIRTTIPSEKSLASAMMANVTFNGDPMWEYWPAVGDITNSSFFSAIPVGYANTATGKFSGVYEYAAFWTATSVEDDDTMAYYKYLICDESDIYTGKADKKSFGASVRCIRK